MDSLGLQRVPLRVLGGLGEGFVELEFPFGALEPGENPGKREHTSHHLTKVEVIKAGGTDNTSGSRFG